MELPEPAFDWRSVESADYREYIANLRGVGCPEPVIRDLIMLEVRRQFVARAAAIRGAQPAAEYWQRETNPELTVQQRRELEAIQQEEQATVSALLGFKPSGQALIDQLYLQLDNSVVELGFLATDKREAARRAFADAGLRDEERSRPEGRGDRRETENRRLQRRLELLKDILSPEELTEYRLRNSQTARDLGREAYFSDLTPDQFQRIVELRDKSRAAGGDPRRQQEEEKAAIRELLGSERFADFERTTDLTYFYAREATLRYHLPEGTADILWRMKQDTIAAGERLRADQSLSADERFGRLMDLMRQAKTTYLEHLGQHGVRLIRNDGAWLQLLTMPRE